MIKVIENLYLTEKGCSIKYRNKFYSAHFQQGELDGACAVYSLMMYLLILKIVTRNQLEDLYGYVKKPDHITKLFKSLFENRGLVRDGFNFPPLQKIVNRYLYEKVSANSNYAESDYLQVIKDSIDNDNPIMIAVSYKGGAHALLAIGYEADNKGLFNIFCLDPAYKRPTTTYWNSVICLDCFTGSTYRHQWLWDGPQFIPGIEKEYDLVYPHVFISEILSIKKI